MQLWRRIRFCHHAVLWRAQSHLKDFFPFFTWNSLCSDTTPDALREMELATPPVYPPTRSQLVARLCVCWSPLHCWSLVFTPSCSNCVVYLNMCLLLTVLELRAFLLNVPFSFLLGAIDGFCIPRTRRQAAPYELLFVYPLVPVQSSVHPASVCLILS